MDTVPVPRVLHKEEVKTKPSLPPDGTAPLLKGGIWTLATGLLSALSIRLFFGGIGEHGPHTNMGWLLLIVTMMCLPFGSMIFLLGAAKWLRNRRLSRQ
jgi:drug/metabolite transporter (DMT)-like permease